MSRGLVEGAVSPIPFGSLLPAIYRELDSNSMRVTESLDIAMASVFLSLDNLPWYFDPRLAPQDFLGMLAGWVGMTMDDNWREDQKRRLVLKAVELYTWRGTKEGLAALVEAYTGVVPEIEESGGVVYSIEPGAQLPGSPRPGVRVRVQLPPGGDEDLARLTRIIADAVPAHVAVTVEMARSAPAGEPGPDRQIAGREENRRGARTKSKKVSDPPDAVPKRNVDGEGSES